MTPSPLEDIFFSHLLLCRCVLRHSNSADFSLDHVSVGIWESEGKGYLAIMMIGEGLLIPLLE